MKKNAASTICTVQVFQAVRTALTILSGSSHTAMPPSLTQPMNSGIGLQILLRRIILATEILIGIHIHGEMFLQGKTKKIFPEVKRL